MALVRYIFVTVENVVSYSGRGAHFLRGSYTHPICLVKEAAVRTNPQLVDPHSLLSVETWGQNIGLCHDIWYLGDIEARFKEKGLEQASTLDRLGKENMHSSVLRQSSILGFREALRSLRRDRGSRNGLLPNSLGLVPTMGALHEGHLQLFREARKECDVVAGTIFVNPKQFAPGEDFDLYPMRVESDLDVLANEGLADVVFTPSLDTMYSKDHM